MPSLIMSFFTRTFPAGMAVLVMIGTGLATDSTATAQTIRLGPQYPGETILSERIVRTPAVTIRDVPSDPKPVADEPKSVSDSTDEATASTDFLSMGETVWARMLNLERENAELKAMLEYERKLQRYLESHQESVTRLQQENERAQLELRQRQIEMEHRSARAQLDQDKAALETRMKSMQDKVHAVQAQLQGASRSRASDEDRTKELQVLLKERDATIDQMEEKIVWLVQELDRVMASTAASEKTDPPTLENPKSDKLASGKPKSDRSTKDAPQRRMTPQEPADKESGGKQREVECRDDANGPSNQGDRPPAEAKKDRDAKPPKDPKDPKSPKDAKPAKAPKSPKDSKGRSKRSGDSRRRGDGDHHNQAGTGGVQILTYTADVR